MRRSFSLCFLTLCCLFQMFWATQALQAQDAKPSPAVATTVADVTNELDKVRAALEPIAARLTREDLSEAELGDIRDRTEPLRGQLDALIGKLQPQLDLINRRVAELGKPAEGTVEGDATAMERAAQNADFTALDETMRRARSLLMQVGQTAESAVERRRTKFTTELFQRHPSLLSPELWIATASGFSRDVTSASVIMTDASRRAADRMTPANATILGVALVIAVLLWGPGRKWANALGQRYAVQQVPAHRLRRSAHALWVLFVTLIAPTIAAVVISYSLSVTKILPPRLEPLAGVLVFAIAFVAFVDGLARGILSPDKASWRLPQVSDELASGIRIQARLVSIVYVLGIIISQLNQVIVTRAEATLVTDGLFALANAITFAVALRVLRVSDSDPQTGPSETDSHPLLGLFRLTVWIVIGVILVALVAGYITFAKFLAHQVLIVSIIGALVYLLSAFIDDLFTIGFSGESGMSLWMRSTIGLKRSSIELIGILLSGGLRLVIYGIAALAILAPWGIGSYDAFGWARAFAFGFEIGTFRVSLSAIFLAIFILVAGVLATRVVQRWLELQLLPKTQIETGLQNSIRTGIGYLGFILAVVFSLGTVGLNLQNVAIVAGALSVGIGFGLQSIVNNFVSGLILLAERPVKVGDWVELGTAEGNIRKISVRATEIELFDRSTLIVPNSELISKAVVNKTHANPLGRVKITISVPGDSDLAAVRAVLLDSAGAHMEVMEDPGPSVLLGTISPGAIELTLLAYVATPRRAGSVKSELQFDIARRFREEKIVLPVAAANEQAESIKEVARAIEQLYGRIEKLPAAASPPTLTS